MSITSIISSGQNPNFIAFMAHAGAAYFVISRYGHAHRWVIFATIAVCAIKEFWYDLRYEKSPPQKLSDSALDFAGYMTGLLVGLFL